MLLIPQSYARKPKDRLPFGLLFVTNATAIVCWIDPVVQAGSTNLLAFLAPVFSCVELS